MFLRNTAKRITAALLIVSLLSGCVCSAEEEPIVRTPAEEQQMLEEQPVTMEEPEEKPEEKQEPEEAEPEEKQEPQEAEPEEKQEPQEAEPEEKQEPESEEKQEPEAPVEKTYTITYVLNGGSRGENPETYTEGQHVVFADGVRAGYSFAGWYRDAALKKSVKEITSSMKGNKTVYAKWTANKYKIVFDGNGADNTSSYKQTFTYGKAAALTDCAFKRPGYKFAGWNTAADGSGVSYANKETVKNLTETHGTTLRLYAQWTVRNYTITYVAGGGTVGEDSPATYTIFDEVTFGTPVRPGFVFKGWYKESSLKNRVTGLSAGTTGNKKIYAKWTANKYRVVYDGNGATNVAAYKETFTCGKKAALAANRYKRAGYKFAGWNTEADGSGTAYTDKQKILNLSEENGTVITLYAQWKTRTYSIVYNLKKGAIEGEAVEKYTVLDEVTLPNAVRAGYAFRGWYKDSAFKTRVKSIKAGTTGNITLYGKWDVNRYSVAFHANGADNVSDYTQSIACSETAALTKLRFKRPGYAFTGWNSEADGSGTAYTNGQKVKGLAMTDGAVIDLYAQWQLRTYTLTYKPNGGKLAEGETNPSSYTVLDDFSLASPTKDGYTFQGWYKDSSYKNKVKSITAGTTGNMTLYAKFRANKFQFVFHGNGGGKTVYTQTVTVGKTTKLDTHKYTRSAYTFTGWNTEPDGSGTALKSGKNVTNFTTEDGAVIDLYAQWKPNLITIEFNGTLYDVVNTDVSVLDFAQMTDMANKGVCELTESIHGMCYTFAIYLTASLYNGLTKLSMKDAKKGKHASNFSLSTYQSTSKSAVLQEVRKYLNTGKPQMMMVKATNQVNRHFITVVGYKHGATNLKETDLLIIDSMDGKLEAMDPNVWSNNTRKMHTEGGKYRAELTPIPK